MNGYYSKCDGNGEYFVDSPLNEYVSKITVKPDTTNAASNDIYDNFVEKEFEDSSMSEDDRSSSPESVHMSEEIVLDVSSPLLSNLNSNNINFETVTVKIEPEDSYSPDLPRIDSIKGRNIVFKKFRGNSYISKNAHTSKGSENSINKSVTESFENNVVPNCVFSVFEKETNGPNKCASKETRVNTLSCNCKRIVRKTTANKSESVFHNSTANTDSKESVISTSITSNNNFVNSNTLESIICSTNNTNTSNSVTDTDITLSSSIQNRTTDKVTESGSKRYGIATGITSISEIILCTTNEMNISKNAVPVVNSTNTSQNTAPLTGYKSISKNAVHVSGNSNISENAVPVTDNTIVSKNAVNTTKNMDTSCESQDTLESTGIDNSFVSVTDNINSLNNTVTDMDTSTCISENSNVSTDISPFSAKKKESKVNSGVMKFTDILMLKEKEKIDVIKWFMNLGLLASEYECPCGRKMQLKLRKDCKDGWQWRCIVSGSEKHVTNRCIRAGSLFSESKVPLIDTMLFIHCWIYRIPSDWISLEVVSSNHTYIEWSNRCRDICLDMCAHNETKIGGKDKIILIDGEEWGRPINSGIEIKWVFSGIEEIYSGKYFFKVMKECSKETFLEVVESSVLPGTTIVSEYCLEYDHFDDKDFFSLAELHKYNFDVPDNHSNLKIKTWKDYKKHMPKHRNSYGFDNHIAEYAWRKRYGNSKNKMKNFIEAIKTVYRPRTKDLPTEK